MKVDRTMVVARDAAIWSAGVYGIVHQEQTGVVHVELLVLYMAILAIPGGLGLASLLRGGVMPTQGSASPSVPPQSSGPQSLSGSDET